MIYLSSFFLVYFFIIAFIRIIESNQMLQCKRKHQIISNPLNQLDFFLVTIYKSLYRIKWVLFVYNFENRKSFMSTIGNRKPNSLLIWFHSMCSVFYERCSYHWNYRIVFDLNFGHEWKSIGTPFDFLIKLHPKEQIKKQISFNSEIFLSCFQQ